MDEAEIEVVDERSSRPFVNVSMHHFLIVEETVD
jgi:hypothetical protein